MKRGNRLLSALVLSLMPVTAGLAAQPAPPQATKAGVDAHHAQKGSKPGVDARKKTETARGVPHQTWHPINAARSKEGVESRREKLSNVDPGTAKNTPAPPGMITKAVRPRGTNPAVGAVGTRNAASISGTDLHLRGTTPAVIHPGDKYGARISGTGLNSARGN
jgi:hypothetical protein